MTNVEKGTKGFRPRPLEERFWEKVDKRGPNDCWPWLGSRDGRRGYGSIYVAGRARKATHVSWELANGRPMPEGTMMCHTCDNPPCVNPAHLWPGTMSENILDAVAKGRVKPPKDPAGWKKNLTHCKRGHEFTPENTYRAGENRRGCRTCQRLHDANYRKRKRVARAALKAEGA